MNEKVFLYFPNNRHIYLENEQFDWCICGQLKILGNRKMLTISPFSKFFNASTGESMYIRPGKPELKYCLLLVENENSIDVNEITECDGVCFTNKNRTKKKYSPICTDVTFMFKPGILVQEPFERCQLVVFCKMHNTEIRHTNKNFPSIPQINDALQKYSCIAVCKVLFDML